MLSLPFGSVSGMGMASKAKNGKTTNRRRFDRRDTAIAARLEYGGQMHPGRVDNLSLSGFLFNPPLAMPPETKVKLWLADRAKPLAATVVGVSERGLHGRLHIAAPKLAQLSAEVDDVALLLINATRPPEKPVLAPMPKGVAKVKKPAAKKAAKNPAAKKTALKKKSALKKKPTAGRKKA